MKKLSVIILSHNTKTLLNDCLTSLRKVGKEVDFEIIVSDNASTDGSVEMIEKDYPEVILIRNKSNLGFAKGNNKARKYCKSKYVLLLNSDTIVYKNTLKETINYLDINKDVGAATCKIILPNNRLDKDARRSFITPWIGLTHLFLRLDKIFPESKIFAKYWYGYISPDKTHEVDAIQGAFFLTRKKILDKLGWLDEDYFLDGEDLDLCFKIKRDGWKIYYYPKVSIMHMKGATKGKVESETKSKVSLKNRLRFRLSGVNSMEIFYKKRLWERYAIILNLLVLLGIWILKILRTIRTIVLG
ncbi:glycosyltransferase family 2 protein [Patescibacteria group bacterium]